MVITVVLVLEYNTSWQQYNLIDYTVRLIQNIEMYHKIMCVIMVTEQLFRDFIDFHYF